MSAFSDLKAYFAGPGQLPTVPPTKPPTRPAALPSYKTMVAKATSVLPQADRGLANTDILTMRSTGKTPDVIRNLAAASPDLSATVNAYLRVGIPEDYTVIARDPDGVINVESTKLAQEILRRITYLGDPSLGYNPTTDLHSLSEALGKELLLYGAAALELALDKQRSPLWLNAVSVTKIKFYEEDGGVYPQQLIGGVPINLDIPTFFYVSVDQDLLTPYATSMFESAIQAVLADAAFMNDLRKSMQRVIQPRLIATIIEEKVKTSLPPDVLNDTEKLTVFYNDLMSAVQGAMTGLNPEDALVGFDSVEYTMLTSTTAGGNVGDTLKTVQNLLESKLAAGAKTMPAVMGRDGSGTSATTSTMLFMKNADLIRRKLNVLYSRAVSQAVRLLGQDVYVEFRYADLDLRPQAELEAYKAMRQSRILELLSLGMLSDEEACIQLTGNLPRDGYAPLAGTMFKGNAAPTANEGNPDSQTSNMKPQTPAAPKSGSGPKPTKA